MGSQKQPVTGSFDGDGHSITGMSITFDSNGQICRRSVPRPLRLCQGHGRQEGGDQEPDASPASWTSPKTTATPSLTPAASLAVRNMFPSTDITTNVAVTAKKGSAPYPWSYVGGFAGTVKNADFLRCVNNGTVTTDGDYVSGFAAKSETTTYTSCVNNGAITGRTKIGGFGGAVKSHEDSRLLQHRHDRPCSLQRRQSGHRRSVWRDGLRLDAYALL